MKTVYLAFFYLLVAGAVCLPHKLAAQADEDSTRWTVDDLIRQEAVAGFVFARDGKSAVWLRNIPSEEQDGFISKIWLTRFDAPKGENRHVQLTRGESDESDVLMSPDGETVYFLSDREDGDKLWALSLMGGEPYVVDSFPNGIGNLSWLGDSAIIFEAEEGKTWYEQQLEEAKDETVVVEDSVHWKPTRLFAYHLEEGTVRRLTNNRHPIEEYAVSPDGRWIVSSHTPSPHYGVDGKPTLICYLWDVRTGARVQLFETGFQTPGSFQFAPDNTGFYFIAVRSSDPEWGGSGVNILYFYDLATRRAVEVPLGHPNGTDGQFQVTGNTLLISLYQGPVYTMGAYQKKGLTWTRKTFISPYPGHTVSLVAATDSQHVLFIRTGASFLIQYRVGTLRRAASEVVLDSGRVLMPLNTHLASKPLAKSEIIYWVGALKDTINGILYYPEGYVAGRAYPLIVAPHGGPHANDRDEWQDSWAYYPNIISQRGAFLLMPNYHGSSGQGQAFSESIKKHYYEYEVPDIIAGINHLIGKGMVHPDSLGAMGWSNGAILTTKLILEYPDMFKVAAPGAGDVNWTSDYGTCEFGVTFDQSYIGGAPWDDTRKKTYNETYILKSPLFEVEKIKTPTILFHGSDDRAVPRDQSWEFYRGLQQVGKAPVRFIWFPGQQHGLRKLSYQKRKVTEELRWLDTYLFGTYKLENESFNEKSPLKSLLDLEEHRLSNGWYGYMENKTLLPAVAVVQTDSIALGVFEVTHAQYAQHKPDHQYLPVQANLPVTGLSYQAVQAYVRWLREQTGKPYRLPNAAEGKALHALALDCAADENTLTYWAGYEITVDEVPMLQEKLKTVTSTLLQPVGTYAPVTVGQARIYDLGGNAAEYCDQNGQPGRYGYSAWELADPAAPRPPADFLHTGFRVVLDLK
ncbi:MAG: prolyl oligopeptidase family serine peptidase [Bacteroidia bacterium]|nr:prolyl oligopeptidase family serine peptidase [Bacteroidia bacterium]